MPHPIALPYRWLCQCIAAVPGDGPFEVRFTADGGEMEFTSTDRELIKRVEVGRHYTLTMTLEADVAAS